MSEEERRFMWNLAFLFTVKHRVAAFKAYYSIRSFITYNGIFMAHGYDLGVESVWRKFFGHKKDSHKYEEDLELRHLDKGYCDDDYVAVTRHNYYNIE